jgi:hypothetical protein
MRRLDHALARLDRLDAAGELRRQPLDHAGIEPAPCLLEQILLEEAVLGIEDDDLRPRLMALEVIRHHRGALIGAGRAAERVRRRHDDEEAAVRHGVKLPLQQLGLPPGDPGMWQHGGGDRVIALDGIEAEADAGGDDEPVIGQALAAL